MEAGTEKSVTKNQVTRARIKSFLFLFVLRDIACSIKGKDMRRDAEVMALCRKPVEEKRRNY